MSHTISLPVVRFSLAGLLSLLTTFLLFFFMQTLIKPSGIIKIENTAPTPTINFVRLQRDETVKPREIVKPPLTIDDPPPIAPPESLVDPEVGRTQVVVKVIDTRFPGEKIGPGMIAAVGGDILPILKVQPNYPHSAIAKGIEGYVIVEFTVTSSGATRDIKIVEAEPDNIFNRASIRAAEKFKYKPRVINGTPVEVRGVRNKFIFNLE